MNVSFESGDYAELVRRAQRAGKLKPAVFVKAVYLRAIRAAEHGQVLSPAEVGSCPASSTHTG